MLDPAEADSGIPSASLFENARLNATVIVPNGVQGIFRRRRPAVAAACAVNVDGQAIALLEGMARSYAGGPVWVRVLRERALLLLEPGDIARALDGSPDPFAPDPEPKRKGMCHFQPEALTLSRGAAWRNRRNFTESVLAEASLDGEMSERIARVCGQELADLLTGPAAIAGGEIGWDPFHACVQRIARRLILGDIGAEDTELSEQLEELMSAANSMPGEPAEELPDFEERLGAYVDEGEPGSLVGNFAAAPSDEETAPVGQIAHWLFALGDTLAINALRALVLLSCHPEEQQRCSGSNSERCEAVLQEAMRLWPTTPVLSRVISREIEWNGEGVPAGTQVLIVNLIGHRSRDRLGYADRFAPGVWLGGEAVGDRGLNHFSSGPQACPGQGLALGVGALLLGGLAERGLEPISPKLDPTRPMPQMLDYFSARVRTSGSTTT